MTKYNREILYTILFLNLSVFACSAPPTSIAPELSKVTPTQTPIILQTPNPINTIKPSPKPSSSITPTSKPSPTISPPASSIIESFKVISSDGKTMSTDYTGYNDIFNSQKIFFVQVFYKDGSTSVATDTVWTTEDPDVATVSNKGVVSTGSKEGSAKITVALKSGDSTSDNTFSFYVNSYKSFDYTYYVSDPITGKQNLVYATREKYVEASRACSCDPVDIATFNGKVYDRNGVPVDDASVSAVSSQTGVTFVAQTQKTIGGAYVFRNAPVGTRLLVTVTKPGWTTRTQTVVLKSNLTGDPSNNVLNFGTDNTTNSDGTLNGSISYAIQDEPEVTSIKINDKAFESAFLGDRINVINSSVNSNTGSSSLIGMTPTNLSLGNIL